jgi:hypothetical protein
MALEYKQKGTPDVNHKGYKSYGKGRRFAGVLQPQERCAGICQALAGNWQLWAVRMKALQATVRTG